MVIIINVIWRRSCFVVSHVFHTKILVSIETLSSLFLSLSTGGGWKSFWDGQNFLFLTNEGILSCLVVVVCCLSSASVWGPSFSLFGGVRAREPHTCAWWVTGVEAWITCSTRPDITHTIQKTRSEGVENKMNDLRQGQGRRRPKWLSLEGHHDLNSFLCTVPYL